MRTSFVWVMVAGLFLSAVGCGEEDAYKGHPGDRFFRGVVTGNNPNTWQDFSGAVNVVLFDPEQAAARDAADTAGNKPGTNPNINEVWGEYYPETGNTVTLTGTWDGNSFEASGDGWTFDGEISGPKMDADVSGPNGEEGTADGYDTYDTQVGTFCGSYSGDGSGRWNFFVAGDGTVSGSFTGTEAGSLRGHASGDSISISWRSDDGSPSGGASGTIGTNGVIVGDWSGSTGWGSVGGTWQSDGSCSPVDEDPFANVNLGCLVGCCCSLDVCVCH